LWNDGNKNRPGQATPQRQFRRINLLVCPHYCSRHYVYFTAKVNQDKKRIWPNLVVEIDLKECQKSKVRRALEVKASLPLKP
jgi:hypothetical protein